MQGHDHIDADMGVLMLRLQFDLGVLCIGYVDGSQEQIDEQSIPAIYISSYDIDITSSN